VQLVRSKKTGKLLVWKKVHYGQMKEREKQQLTQEVNILASLKHENIVRYYDLIIDKKTTTLYILMEYCAGGDLSKVIKQTKEEQSSLGEDFIWRMLLQIVLALYECHKKEKKVLHRDLKPQNVFLDANQNAKLGDFGLARQMNIESVNAKTYVGTPFYMSPEQINETEYNEKSDIWSLGVVLYEMAALRPPF